MRGGVEAEAEAESRCQDTHSPPTARGGVTPIGEERAPKGEKGRSGYFQTRERSGLKEAPHGCRGQGQGQHRRGRMGGSGGGKE